jgi:hypothetical protein
MLSDSLLYEPLPLVFQFGMNPARHGRNCKAERKKVSTNLQSRFCAFCFAQRLLCASDILARTSALNVRQFRFGSDIIRTVFPLQPA